MDLSYYIIDTMFRSKGYTPTAQVISSFCVGILFSPYSWGLLYFVMFMIIFELLEYIFTQGDPEFYQVTTRLGVICGYFLGWIIGRRAAGLEVLGSGL